jgi:hypothetical protein
MAITNEDFFTESKAKEGSLEKEGKVEFLKRVRLKKYQLDTQSGPIEFSAREIQCVAYRSKGLRYPLHILWRAPDVCSDQTRQRWHLQSPTNTI